MPKQIAKNFLHSSFLPCALIAGLCMSLFAQIIFSLSSSASFFFLAFLSTPLVFVCLKYGKLCATVSFLVATGISSQLIPFPANWIFIVFFFFPATLVSNFFLWGNTLHRKKRIKMPPLSWAFFCSTLSIAVLASLVAVYAQNTPSLHGALNQILAPVEQALQKALLEAPYFNPQTVTSLLHKYFLPLFFTTLACYSLAFTLLYFYIGLKAVYAVSPENKFWVPWPENLRLPKTALVIFALSIGICIFFPHFPFIVVAEIFSCVFNLSFFIVGLAFLHQWSRGVKGRTLLLCILYTLLLFFTLLPYLYLILFVMGVWACFR